MGRVATWFSKRFHISPAEIKESFNEPVPNHLKHWWFCLGGIPAFLFLIQIVTGILLAFYYEASASRAYESVRFITEEAAYGWYIRNLHKWSATLMIATIILHQIRVFFTGAYRKPRELNWMVGMSLLGCTLVLGFTGYSLVYEQLSYWGVTVGANISESVPVVGEYIKRMMLGGDSYNEHTISRFYILHVAVLPATLIALIALHVAIIRMQGITEFSFEEEESGKKYFNFIPDHVYTELIVGLILLVILNVLTTVFPAPLGPKADPLTTPAVIKPEWFFFTAYRWLKLFSRTTAILSTGFLVFVMFIWPFIDGWIRKNTRYKEASIWIGILVVITIVALTLWEAIVEH